MKQTNKLERWIKEEAGNKYPMLENNILNDFYDIQQEAFTEGATLLLNEIKERDEEIERLLDALDKITSYHPDCNPIGIINYAKAVLNKNTQP